MEKDKLLVLFDVLMNPAGKGGRTAEEEECLALLKQVAELPVRPGDAKAEERLRRLTIYACKKFDLTASKLSRKGNKNEPAKSELANGDLKAEKCLRVVSTHSCQKTRSSASKLMGKSKSIRVKKTGSGTSQGANKETVESQEHDSMRDKIRELLLEALQKVSSEAAGFDLQNKANSIDPSQVANSVERALFNKWGSFKGPNNCRYRSVMFNMKDPKNPDFRRKVLLGEIRPEVIPELRTEQMASDHRKLENEKIKGSLCKK